MRHNNPVHQAIYDHVVKPALTAKNHEAEGVIIGIDYYKQLIDVEWTENHSGQKKVARSLPIPKEADGVIRQSPKVGDLVQLNFRNGNIAFPHIVTIFKLAADERDFYSKKGASIPKGIGYI